MPKPKSLTEHQVAHIRRCFAYGVPLGRIAREYGISVKAVRDVVDEAKPRS
jgi:hypothetical protein